MGLTDQVFQGQARMTFSTPHKVFFERGHVRQLDGSPVSIANLAQQRAKSVCSICGDPVINPDWPTDQWRHMTPDEAARYAAPAGKAAED